MKKIIALFLLVFSSTVLFAQNDSASLNFYGSITGTTNLSPDSVSVLQGSTAKLYLAAYTQYPTMLGTINGLVVYKSKPTGVTAYSQVWDVVKISNTVSAKFGYLGKPITYALRQFPSTPGGDFEASATEEIPGGALGFRLHYNSSGFEAVGGVFQNKSEAEYGASSIFDIGNVQCAVGGYYSSLGKGAGLSMRHSNFDFTFFKSDDVSSLVVDIYTAPVCAYFSGVYNHPTKSWNDMEIGLFRSFPVKNSKFSALIGAGYLPKLNQINAYIWINTGILKF